MQFSVTMSCGECGRKFAGQGEHLVDAVGAMVKSAYEGNHAKDRMNQELEALAHKAEGVNAVDSVLSALGLEIVGPPLTQEQFEEFLEEHRDGDEDG